MIFLRKDVFLLFIGFIALFVFYANYESQVSVAYREIYKTDFPNYYFAGQKWLSGKPVYVSIKEDVFRAFNWDRYIAYTADTPLTVIMLAPLFCLDIRQGAFVLNTASIIILIFSIYYFSRQYNFNRLQALFFTSLALSSFPFIFLLRKCHMEIFVLLAGILGLIALKKSRLKTCGVFWGIAAGLKIFPLLWFAPYFFIKKRSAVFYAGMFSFVFFTGVSAVLIGSENLYLFINQVIPRSREWYGAVGNYSLISFYTALAGIKTAEYLFIVSVAVMFFILYKKISTPDISDQKIYALTTSAALLISPLSWLNYMILFFPVLISLVKKYNFIRLQNYLPLLLLFTAFWAWPDYIGTPWYLLSLILSFMPMFAMLSIFFYFEKKL